MTQKEELKEKYEELYKKPPFHGWDEAKLQEKIDEFVEKSSPKKEKKELEIDPSKVYVFKLIGEYAPVVFFPSKMNTFDEEEKRTRAIRCVSVEDSPYVDEQSDEAKVDIKPIAFNNGILRVDGADASRIKYLLATDAIQGKKKILPENTFLANRFELEDKSLLVKKDLELEEAELDAKQLVKKSKTEDLKNYLRSVYLTSVDTMTDDEVLLEANRKAKEHPQDWLKDFNNPSHKIKAGVQKLFAQGELDDTNGAIKWKKTGGVIINYDEKGGVRSDDILTKFVMVGGKEAEDFKKTMESKIS